MFLLAFWPFYWHLVIAYRSIFYLFFVRKIKYDPFARGCVLSEISFKGICFYNEPNRKFHFDSLLSFRNLYILWFLVENYSASCSGLSIRQKKKVLNTWYDSQGHQVYTKSTRHRKKTRQKTLEMIFSECK